MNKTFLIGMAVTFSLQMTFAAGGSKPVELAAKEGVAGAISISKEQAKFEESLKGRVEIAKKSAGANANENIQATQIAKALNALPEISRLNLRSNEISDLAIYLAKDSDNGSRKVGSMVEAQRLSALTGDKSLTDSAQLAPALMRMSQATNVKVKVKPSVDVNAEEFALITNAVRKNDSLIPNRVLMTTEQRASYNTIDALVANKYAGRTTPEEAMYLGFKEEIQIENPSLSGVELHKAVMKRIKDLVDCT